MKTWKPPFFVGFLVIFTIIFAFASCNSNIGNNPDNLEIEKYYNYEINVAYMFKYYEYLHGKKTNALNVYVGDNEIYGQCGDYALMMAKLYKADIIIQNQGSPHHPNGIYSLIGEFDAPENLQNICSAWGCSGLWELMMAGSIHIGIYHPELGYYELKLKQPENIRDISGQYVTSPHVWNILNGVMLYACYIDTGYQR